MAEHVHKSYSCDRCGVGLGSERPRRNQPSVVQASFNWTEGPGPTFSWRDLCDNCDVAVKAFFLADSPPTYMVPDGVKAFRDLIDRAAADGKAVTLLRRAAFCIGIIKLPKGGGDVD